MNSDQFAHYADGSKIWDAEAFQALLRSDEFGFLNGLTIHVLKMQDGICEIDAEVAPDQLRPGNSISGPTMFCIADIAMFGATLQAMPDPVHTVTNDLAMRFLSRPQLGTIRARAELLRRGRKSTVGTVDLRDQQGNLIAHVTSSYASSQPPVALPVPPHLPVGLVAVPETPPAVQPPPSAARATERSGYLVYTDGSCLDNPGIGGWAYRIYPPGADSQPNDHAGGMPKTTNNRAEMQAVIEALMVIPEHASVRLYTDSEYIVKGITQWVKGWQNNGWKSRSGSAVKNKTQWLEIIALTQTRTVQWQWIQGHAGHPENEAVDELARRAALSYSATSG